MKFELTFNKKILILFVFPIVFQVEPYINNLYIKHDYLLFRIFRIFLSQVLFIIPILIIECQTRKNSKEYFLDSNSNKDNETARKISGQVAIEIRKNKSKQFKKNILFLLLLSALDLIAFFVNYIYYDEPGIKFFLNSIGILFEIINFGVLSYFVLKQKFYKHHFISFGIIFVSLMVLFIVYVVEIDFHFYIIAYYFIYTLFYSLYCVLGKLYFNKLMRSPYYMLFMIGLINSIGLLLYDIIAYFVNVEYSSIIIGLTENLDSFLHFLYFFIELIIKFIYTAGIWISIYYLTPYHFIISDFMSGMFKFYITAITEAENEDEYYDTTKIIIFTIVYVINFICSLIFNELFICKLCELHYYTEKYIKIREVIELSTIEKEENDQRESINSML